MFCFCSTIVVCSAPYKKNTEAILFKNGTGIELLPFYTCGV